MVMEIEEPVTGEEESSKEIWVVHYEPYTVGGVLGILRSKVLSENGKVEQISGLCEEMSELELRCKLTLSDFTILAEVIRKTTALKELTLDGCSIETDGAIALADGIKDGSSLVALHILNDPISADGALAFTGALDGPYSLQRFSHSI